MNKYASIRFTLVLALAAWTVRAAAAEKQGEAGGRLSWDPRAGVELQSPFGKVSLDCGAKGLGPILRFPGKGVEVRLSSPKAEQLSPRELLLRYQVTGPGDNGIGVVRRITMVQREDETELTEEFSLTPAQVIDTDLEIERPFSLRAAAGTPQAVLPLYNGWARTCPLGGEALRGQWQLGNVLADVPSQQLALPVVEVGQKGKWLAAVCADPYFGSLYELSAHEGRISGAVRWRYAGSKVPLAAGRNETRHFGVWLAAAKPDEPFGRSLDAFFRLMLPDVPPGPKWLHEIAMVGYDYLSDGGKGWEKDARELARLLPPDQRSRVALCFHGWYETIGGYGYDDARKEMKQHWVAMGRTRKVRFTQDEVRRQLKMARDLGFRVLWYFGDGILQDSGTPCYRPEWDFVDEQGKRVVSGWTGPDTWGRTFARNPAHPQVSQWYQDYLAALLKAYGPVVDGFVWDETFYIRTGATTRVPQPAYCDRAMLTLIKALTAQVRTADPQKVFLASDCLGGVGTNIPGYAIVADGTYQDTACAPAAWSYGLFPAWRNVLWSCNWWSVTKFNDTRWGVQRYGVPVAISNGWEDDRGPWKWTPQDREKILALFRQRLARKDRVRYLTVDPAVR
jgi:hypothetical protein